MAQPEFADLYRAYEACRRRKRGTPEAQRYASRLLDHLIESVAALRSRRWRPGRSVSFVVRRPKAREIHAAPFAERVVHHYLTPRLEALYEPVFIHDVYSNRRGKGIHAAVGRLQYFMRRCQTAAAAARWRQRLERLGQPQIWVAEAGRQRPGLQRRVARHWSLGPPLSPTHKCRFLKLCGETVPCGKLMGVTTSSCRGYRDVSPS
jgi:hypothetical protein